MSEKKRYTIDINGTEYPILTHESEEYIHKIEYFINTRIRDSKNRTGMHFSNATTLAMLAISTTDELFKTQMQFNSLKTDAEKLMQEYDRTRAENKEYIEQIGALEAQIDELKAKIYQLQAKL